MRFLHTTRTIVFLAIMLFLTSACVRGDRAIVRQQGEAIRPAWREPGPGLGEARAEATAEARLRLWDELMQRTVEPGVTLEQAVLINPALESRLRGEIASLTPAREIVTPDGLVTVTLALDARRYNAIIRRYWQPTGFVNPLTGLRQP